MPDALITAGAITFTTHTCGVCGVTEINDSYADWQENHVHG